MTRIKHANKKSEPLRVPRFDPDNFKPLQASPAMKAVYERCQPGAILSMAPRSSVSVHTDTARASAAAKGDPAPTCTMNPINRGE